MAQYRSTGSDVLVAIHAALMAAAVGVLVATLTPFQLQAPAWSRFLSFLLALRWIDVALNLALFAPLGLLVALRRRALGGARAPLAGALLCGALLSAVIEILQLFVATRCPSAIDVAANALGFAAGSFLSAPLAGQVERALLAALRVRLGVAAAALCLAICALLALAPPQARVLHDGALETLAAIPALRGVRVIAILLSLGAATLTFALAVLCARAPVRGAARCAPRPDRVWV